MNMIGVNVRRTKHELKLFKVSTRSAAEVHITIIIILILIN
jgi:hypothetical protein